MYTLNNVRAYYETSKGLVKAVDGVSLEIRRNEILGIAGESGCGKSTLIKVIYGYLKPPLILVDGEISAEMVEDGRLVMLSAEDLPRVWWKYI